MTYDPPRCRAVPVPGDQVSFEIDGRERTRWHFGGSYPRPFFYPLLGPSGALLTRIGHPGAPNHDHHRSIWFAHAKLLGIDFWSDQTEARIRQQQWLCYRDGDDEAVMAVTLHWHDGHDPAELLAQELVAAVRPGERAGETQLEVQATFTPRAESLELGQTNFGFLAVRVAKSISAHFGGGVITNSEGARQEAEVFGGAARWVDYSGPVDLYGDEGRRSAVEGITFFDHPDNPGHPAHWHVREDGWMGASFCMNRPYVLLRDDPLVLRYLLDVHAGEYDPKRAEAAAKAFAQSRRYIVRKAEVKHEQYRVARES